MKEASRFEKIAARCWNLLNEGKPFTPIFAVGVMVISHAADLIHGHASAWLLGLAAALPLFVVYYVYDYPLFLRNYLWIPYIVFLIMWSFADVALLLLSAALYFFFTVFFWGTLYYHLRIGTSWWNFTRFWKLVLKNSDSTSGNAQEQLPKLFLLLSVWEYAASLAERGADWLSLCGPFWLFAAAVWLFSSILHRHLFDWQPEIIPTYTSNVPSPTAPVSDKVYVIVIDGMRKDRFEAANAPFLKRLRAQGTEFAQMETVYPARTVVCFTSMLTGTYPFEHGIRSNMVWKLGAKVETIFDSLRKIGKTGRLLGIAHLVDSFGDDVETVTAVMPNDLADRYIIERAKRIVEEQNPDLLVVQLIATDQTGHSRGVLYDEYIEKIEEADALIAEFVSWLAERGELERATLIVCADHGQADGIGGHGHLDEGERYVPFFLYGPAIERGKRIDEKRSLVSLAPTIAYLLGAPYPSHSRGPVLIEAIRKEERDEEAARHRLFAGAQ